MIVLYTLQQRVHDFYMYMYMYLYIKYSTSIQWCYSGTCVNGHQS